MLVSFSNQKGGSGKTTTTMAFATYATHMFDDISICVVDIDLQKSFYNKRAEEIKYVQKLQEGQNNYNSKFLKSLSKLIRDNKKLYPVFALNFDTENVIEKLKELDSKFDLVLIDFPGTLDKKQISDLLLLLDYIFIPIYAEEKNFKSSLEYELIIQKMKELQKTSPGSSRLIDHYMYFFMYNDYEKKDLWSFLESFFNKKGIKKMKEFIADNSKIETEVSTINKVSSLPKEKALENFVNEIMSVIYPDKYSYNFETKELIEK